MKILSLGINSSWSAPPILTFPLKGARNLSSPHSRKEFVLSPFTQEICPLPIHGGELEWVQTG